jgi:hypothetical protein
MPQYMLLIYTDPANVPGPDSQEGSMESWMSYTAALQESGTMVAGDALEGPDTATTVRVREGDTVVSDGPFAETKEILGGYYLIDVADLDAALEWAAKMPNITYGSVEVRPVMTFE